MKFALLALLAVLPAWAASQVAIVLDSQLDPPARYGIGKLEQALTAKGLTVIQSRAGEPVQADFYVLAGVVYRGFHADWFLARGGFGGGAARSSTPVSGGVTAFATRLRFRSMASRTPPCWTNRTTA